MIRNVLVANRGEIAVRIARTLREMSIDSTVAFAEDDANPVVLRSFDNAVSLGSGDVRKTYLNVGAIIDAAINSGCDAIHPGYGFLSERAELSAACKEAGITFIGPDASSIEKMGSKSGARQLMQQAGVPVVPGYDGDDQSVEVFEKEAAGIGFPLLVKASAGGGGKGMKIVRELSQLGEAISSARREAENAFGNGTLLLERYIENPRHVEFQIFGDAAGNVVHLFERDCSIQRRHQKIIEETPAPRYDSELRRKMGEAAVAAAKAVDYRNAGTVEFIVAPDGSFYFLEMNTRLQVEHPVTELVTGTDLVRLQLRIASGEPLPFAQEALVQRGHSIECRVYAEDPDNGFLPQTGTIRVYREPSGPGIRVDSGVASGSEVTIKYDPMLAKLVVYAETRDAAIARIERALSEFVILGARTNISYLRRVVDSAPFREGLVSTHFTTDHATLLAPPEGKTAAAVAAVLRTFASEVAASRTTQGSVPFNDAWTTGASWLPR